MANENEWTSWNNETEINSINLNNI